jgi:ATP:ADP antiporter, AAA family
MKEKLLRFMSVEPDEAGRVGLLFVMGIFMGMFIATVAVAAQSLYLTIDGISEVDDLPVAMLEAGAYGFIATALYNLLQNRIPFTLLGTISLLAICGLTAFIEFGEHYFPSVEAHHTFAFTMIIPFGFVVALVFWGSFTRLFNLRQAKRLVGTVDIGAMIVTIIAFFTIPIALTYVPTESLYSISLISIITFTLLFLYLSLTHVSKAVSFKEEKKRYKKLQILDFIKNRYILYMSLFIIFSMVAINFLDFAFLNVASIALDANLLDTESLGRFIAFFEGTIVIFTFLMDIFITDRLISQYGMRVTLLINPLLIAVLTLATLGVGFLVGVDGADRSFMIFFLAIAMSKLFIRSLKEAVDNPTFKLYLLPIQSNIRLDVQTKIEGVVTAVANIAAAGLIILITTSELSNLFYVTLFTLPAFAIWYYSTNRMHKSYRQTLQQALVENKQNAAVTIASEYTVDSLLEKEVSSTAEEKVIYGLKLMEKLEPTLFENAVIRLTTSENRKVRKFAEEKMQELGIEKDESKTDIKALAKEAALHAEDSDLLSISVDNLMKLSKSIKQNDRVLGAKLLRKLISHRTIFILLELLRDTDPKVRYEALLTARKVKRQETWPILIEMLSSPSYGHHAAAALKESGEAVLSTLEAAFHKSGQTDLVMLRIVQIMGRIGGPNAIDLLWKKADFPDKRIVKQILYSLRYINYQAKGKEIRDVTSLLETEISKTMWNLAALSELPETQEYFFLREALRDEVSENYDHIAILLSVLYDPKSVQLVRENLQTGDPDNITFAMELLDLFVDQNLKPKLFPLLDDSSTDEKLEQLQIHFPREKYHPIQVINYILNRDFNLNNRWTKACAIHMAAFMPEFRVSRGLAAQVFNHDRLLQETAAWVIYNKDKKAFLNLRDRLPAKDKKFLDNSIEDNQLLEGLDDGFFLGIETVMFLKTVHVFRNIQGSFLCDLADKVQYVELEAGQSTKFNHQEHNSPIFIVAHGKVNLVNENDVINTLVKGDVYGDLFQEGPPQKATSLAATERSVVFRIDMMDFYFVMANHHELVHGLIENITEQKQTIPTN